jgi:hypothetical protein
MPVSTHPLDFSRRATHPTPDLALVRGHDAGNVALDGGSQRGLVAYAADEAGQLRVPDKGVATNRLVVRDGPVDQVVGLLQGESALLRLRALPLHAVLGRHLAKVLVDDIRVLAR